MNNVRVLIVIEEGWRTPVSQKKGQCSSLAFSEGARMRNIPFVSNSWRRSGLHGAKNVNVRRGKKHVLRRILLTGSANELIKHCFIICYMRKRMHIP